MTDDDLHRLAHRVGILPSYHDLAGVEHVITTETQAALLAAMGLPSQGSAVAEMLAGMEAREHERALPTEIIVPADMPFRVDARHAIGAWTIELEDGGEIAGVDDMVLELPPLPMGYHRFWRGRQQTLLITAPDRAPGVADLCGHDRIWGFTAALYGLRSERNHGIGDFDDLARAAENVAPLGADFFGVNPLHALGAASNGFSPYSPTHRGFYNDRHIALDRVPEFARCAEARQLLANRSDAATPHGGDLIDHGATDAIADAVQRALYECFVTDTDPARLTAFKDFRRSRGEALALFTTFEAISGLHGANPMAWPSELQAPDSAAVADLANGLLHEISFHAYLQWIAETQLAEAQSRARSAGMGLGIYADLAVGVRPDGAEPWARPDIFAPGVSLGVPPDAFNSNGQVWGLAPMSPHGLAASEYQPFITTLRAAMRHAGLIRIDHAIGLMRCFWVPEGDQPGAYVRYPLRTLLAIIRLEAARNGCIVVGEDLGVVPDGLRSALDGSGLYGVSVLQFEREDDGMFTRPEAYRKTTLASIGTHDTPTLAGFWQGCDVDTRVQLGQYSADDAEREHGLRSWDRSRLLHLLDVYGLKPEDLDGNAPPDEMRHDLNVALHEVLSMTSAEMAAVQIDDALGSRRQPNFPGTTDEYPNWRIPCAVSVEGLGDDDRLVSAARAMSAHRPKDNLNDRQKKEA